MRRWLPFLPLALALLACGTFSLPTLSNGTSFAEGYGLDPTTTLTLVSGQPRTLDPALTRSGPDGPIGHIFSGLVTLDQQLQVRPELAAGWDVSDDGTTYTFFLRRDARFHDGRPVTAADVIYSWERATNPALGADNADTYLGDIVGVSDKLHGMAPSIRGVRALDDHTLEVQVDAPKPYFLAKLTFPVAYVVDRNQVEENGWEREPNGTGPFKLQEWRDDEVLILERNPDYYGVHGNVRHVLLLIGQGIPLSLYEQDRIDVVGIGGPTLERALDPNDPLAPDLRTGVTMCTTTIGFDTTRPPFDDARARQAFSYALDRETIVEALYEGQVLPARGPLPPGMPGYTGLENSDAPRYAFDPSRAQGLLEAYAAEEGPLPPLNFVTSGYTDAGGLVEAAVTMWQETLGVDITVTLLDPFIYFDELYAGNIGHLFSSGWCADYPDPENFVDVLFYSESRQNLGRYSNATIDQMLLTARSEPNVGERMAQYGAIEAALVTDAAVVWIGHSEQAALVKPRLTNYALTPIGVPQWHRINITAP